MMSSSAKKDSPPRETKGLKNVRIRTKDKNALTLRRDGIKIKSQTIAFLVKRKLENDMKTESRNVTTRKTLISAVQERKDGSRISLRDVILHVKALQRKSDKPRLRTARRHSEEKSVTSALTMLTRLSQQTSRCAIVMMNRKLH